MADASGLGELNVFLGELEESISPIAQVNILKGLELQAKAAMYEPLVAALGTDRRFSGWPRLGSLDVHTQALPVGNGAEMRVRPTPYGGWIVAERGRQAGSIAPKRRRTVVMAMPWGPRTYLAGKPLVVGRAPGHRVLTKGVILLRLRLPIAYDEAVQLKLARITRG